MALENKPFADAFRGAVEARGITLARPRTRLTGHGSAISTSALSYWRTGERKPEGARSLSALSDIEEILLLDRGALSALLPPSSRIGTPSPVRTPEGIELLSASIDVMGRLLLSEPLDNVRPLSVHIAADVDSRGVVVRQRQRVRIQAVRTPMREFTWVEMAYAASPVPARIQRLVRLPRGADRFA